MFCFNRYEIDANAEWDDAEKQIKSLTKGEKDGKSTIVSVKSGKKPKRKAGETAAETYQQEIEKVERKSKKSKK